jgi:cysteine desulfurase
MNQIYLDNAATTRTHPEVLHAMLPFLSHCYGNPSSTHFYGREARIAIEESRKKVAGLLGVKPGTIVFTSGGTESSNTAISAAVRDDRCNHLITSPLEHHAVLHPFEHWSDNVGISSSLVSLTNEGGVYYNNLEDQLIQFDKVGRKCFVTLMGANNETGILLDTKRVADLCLRYDAIFHCDAVQTVGHYPLNLEELGMHYLSAAAHKFGGPKGIGLLYIKDKETSFRPLLLGGAQERGNRAGTENVAGIVGFAKALELAMAGYEENKKYILRLKNYLAQQLRDHIPGIHFNGPVNDTLYTVLSVNFPRNEDSEMLLLNLDMKGICASGGSACSSGAASHVMRELGKHNDYVTVRFSFSPENTLKEMDTVIGACVSILNPQQQLKQKTA